MSVCVFWKCEERVLDCWLFFCFLYFFFHALRGTEQTCHKLPNIQHLKINLEKSHNTKAQTDLNTVKVPLANIIKSCYLYHTGLMHFGIWISLKASSIYPNLHLISFEGYPATKVNVVLDYAEDSPHFFKSYSVMDLFETSLIIERYRDSFKCVCL